jgi:hypothetical protein
MPELLQHPDTLSPDFTAATLGRLATGSKLVPTGSLDGLIEYFSNPEPIDPYDSVRMLAGSSAIMDTLLCGKTGVRENYQLHEHTQAVLQGFESDYAAFFDDTQTRRLLRTSLLWQDIGKSLCVAVTNDRHQQDRYNKAVRLNILSSVSSTALDIDDRQTMSALLEHDILGTVLKGYKNITPTMAEIELQAQRRGIADRYKKSAGAMMRAIYMSDVTAYTSFRSYRRAFDGEQITCRPSLDQKVPILKQSNDGQQVMFSNPDNQRLLLKLTADDSE